MDFVSATADWNVAFTKLTTKNGNISYQLRQQLDLIRALKAELCNLKVAVATQTTNTKVCNKGVQLYECKENRHHSGQRVQRRKKATKITDHPMGMIQETRTHQTQAQEQWLDTSRRLRNMTQWGTHKTISQAYGRIDEREVGEMIISIVYYPVMLQFTINLKIYIYGAISLDCQPQKTHKKQKRIIPWLLIQDVREVSHQYLSTSIMCDQQ